MNDLLAQVIAGRHPSFALLYRPLTDPNQIDVLVGPARQLSVLADVAVSPDSEEFLMIPYRQIAERGWDCIDDGSPLLALTVRARRRVELTEALDQLPRSPLVIQDADFDVSDADYADAVRRIVSEEIGHGVGANFVLKRTFRGQVLNHTLAGALSVFRKLLDRERGTYWTFLVHIDGTTWVGATPERHVGLDAGTAVMNPISGTYRYSGASPDLSGLMTFLKDEKETDELYMVVDEELKLMAQVCPNGVRLSGPHLKEMANVAHTEYYISGSTDRPPTQLLRETMFAPTVVGSPLESACRVIARREPTGRRYYSGVAALLGHDAQGRATLDSAILIRTAEIDPGGELRIAVGSTIVRHSRPAAEVAETRAKATSLINALTMAGSLVLAEHPAVVQALHDRNRKIGRFWLTAGNEDRPTLIRPGRAKVLVIDAEDSFTAMLTQLLASLGMAVTVRRFDQADDLDGYQLVVMGPGPGDPSDLREPKIVVLRSLLQRLVLEGRPFLAICLSHQILCSLLGLPVTRKAVPQQGLRREIDHFGRSVRVAFYNTFCAVSETTEVSTWAGPVELAIDDLTGEVHAMRGTHFHTMQFHPESILTEDGPRILDDAIARLHPPASAAIQNPSAA